jgi:intracellular sulfur oxidation DsrE/DsrF family protein
MSQLDRRHLVSGLALAGGLAAAGAVRAAPQPADIKALKKDTDVACVYHCDFGDPGRVRQMITNINNHLSVYDYDPFKAKILVVAHGQGIKPFIDSFDGTPWTKDTPDPELLPRYARLAKYGVEVFLCRITFKNNKIDEAKALSESFIRFVPSGVATVAELQSKGFAYIKVG